MRQSVAAPARDCLLNRAGYSLPMKDNDWQTQFRQVWERAERAWHAGRKTPGTMFSAEDKTFLTGIGCTPQELFDFVDDNPLVAFHPCDWTNDTAVIRKNPKVVAINSALQIDLTGQVCADSIGHRIFSGIGGQMDFIRGAALSRGGKPIIALPSTAAGGQISRLVPELNAGAGVVTTRGHVHWVVTEYGAVNLHGKSIRERREALISIAHPDFRAELRRTATEVRSLATAAPRRLISRQHEEPSRRPSRQAAVVFYCASQHESLPAS